jgi:hypothetical protein
MMMAAAAGDVGPSLLNLLGEIFYITSTSRV